MSDRNPKPRADDESGVTIIEVVISAALMVIIAGFVFTALESASSAGAQERHRARAYSIAQDDQARMRSLKISELSNLSETNNVTQDGISYTVASTATPKIDQTATASCESGTSSADYIAISTTVTWASMGGRPPALIESIVAPPSGSLAANRGALAVSVVDSDGPLAGVTVTGTGAGTFSGQTGSTGCVIFGDLLAGNYTVTPALSGYVDANGAAPAGKATSVVGQSSNTLSFQYDRPGAFNVNFKTIKSGTTVSPSQADTIRAFNTGMTASKGYGTVGSRVNTLMASTLFPFTSAYSVWAGACDSNNPGAGLAFGSSIAPVAATNPIAVSLQLPALNLTVFRGTSAAPGALAAATTTVRITDSNCSVGGIPVRRTFNTSGSTGRLADPGLPWSDYSVCVRGVSTSGTRWFNFPLVTVKNPSVPTTLNTSTPNVYLRDGATGNCPA